MKTGVSTASLFLRKYNEDALPLLNTLGVKNTEVFLSTYCEYDADFARLLVERKGNVDVNSVHVLNTQYEPQLFNANPRAKRDAFSWLEKVLACAQILQAPYYTFHGTARVKRASRSGVRDDFDKMSKSFQEIVSACQNYGVTLCLENVEWSTYNRVGVFERLKKQVPSLKGVLDIKQARISMQPYEEYLSEMGRDIAYVHVSDIDAQGKMCLPHMGVFDFETLIKRLGDVGFDGAILIETYTQDYDKEIELKIACDYLDELLYKLGFLR